MRTDAFDYDLPQSLIAQKPLQRRTGSRLMVVDRSTGDRRHARFGDLPGFLTAGDVLVVNRSRVIPARLLVRRESGAAAELLVVEVLNEKEFLAIGSPLRKLQSGDVVEGRDGEFGCRIIGRPADRHVRAEVCSDHTVAEVLERFGHVPLPPYIRRADEPSDRNRYQTVYAEEAGSVAAPTAGLHFDEALLGDLQRAGIRICSLVLHVGPGTFLPLEKEAVEGNVLHAESYSISGGTLETVREARAAGRRIVAVGTTVTRVLETAHREGLYDRCDTAKTYGGKTDLFIYPPYEFRVVQALITNFHLPRSSLLLLVCAFLGREETLACYAEAVRERYRFYSYGDAMLIR